MATITSIELYLTRQDPSAPWDDLIIDVYNYHATALTDPDATDLLGTSDAVTIDTISYLTPEWVTFNFSSPVEISGTGYFGFVFRRDPYANSLGVRIFRDASGWNFITEGHTFSQFITGGVGQGWNHTSDVMIKIHITGADDFVKDNVSSNYVTFVNYEYGARVYFDITVAPTLENPTEDGTNYYLNKDWLLEMRWADTESPPIADHTVYFAASGDPEFIPRDDRTRYSIVAYKMFLDVELDYSTTYYWYVRKDLGGGNYVDSETWAFTTAAYTPPAYSTRTKLKYGEDPGGDTETVPSGENNMITVERLIAIARNKFFYEDV